MNLTVFTGPAPVANRDEMLRCTPLSRPAYVLVPDSASASALEKRLTRENGGAFIGHRIVTFESMSSAILSCSDGIPVIIPYHVKRAVIGEIVRSRIGEHSRFAGIAPYPGFITLLASYLEEIRGGRGAGKLRDTELASIAAAYDSHLRRLGMEDHEGIVRRAGESRLAERFADEFRGSLIVDGFYDFTVRQFELIATLARRLPRCSVSLVCDRNRPRLFELSLALLERLEELGAKTVEVPPARNDSASRVLEGFMGGQYSGEGDPGLVQVHRFRSDVSEADWIAGTVRAMVAEDGVSPGDIMIVTRHAPAYGSPLQRALERHGVPVTNGFPRQISSHPLGRLILAALEASVHPDRENLVTMVQASGYTGDPDFRRLYPLGTIDEKGWSCRIAEFDTPEGFVTSTRAMLEDLRIGDNLHAVDGGLYSTADSAVFERLKELLDEFAHVYGPFKKMMRSTEYLRLFRQFIGAVAVSDSRSNGGGVLVTDVNRARHVTRDTVFIAGLDDTSFPGRDMQFSLLDRETAFDVMRRRAVEEPLLFYMSAAGAVRLILTFPGVDDEGKDNAMSPYLREICEGNASWLVPQFHPAVSGDAWESGADSERAICERAVRAFRLHGRGRFSSASFREFESADPVLAGRVASAFNISDAIKAQASIDLSSLSEFEPLPDDTVYPVTALESYNQCPVSYFFSWIMGFSVETEIPGEIDRATRGMIVHDILADFYRIRKETTGRTRFDSPELAGCRALMRTIVDRAFEKAARNMDGVHPVTLLSEKKFVAEWMQSFIDAEQRYFERTGFEPVAFETVFGRTRDNRERWYPALRIANDSLSALVGGRIDRIDIGEGPDGLFVRVIDYKTGKTDVSAKKFESGEYLQLPLYVKAVRDLIHPKAYGGDGYYYSLKDMELAGYTPKKTGESFDWEGLTDIATERALDAIRGIRNGIYPRPEKCDRFCEFKPMCSVKNRRGAEEEL